MNFNSHENTLLESRPDSSGEPQLNDHNTTTDINQTVPFSSNQTIPDAFDPAEMRESVLNDIFQPDSDQIIEKSNTELGYVILTNFREVHF